MIELKVDRKLTEYEKKVLKVHIQQMKVFLQKNRDYGDSFSKAMKKYGREVGLARIEDKMNRYMRLTEHKAEVDEKIEDTLLDLANYIILFYAE